MQDQSIILFSAGKAMPISGSGTQTQGFRQCLEHMRLSEFTQNIGVGMGMMGNMLQTSAHFHSMPQIAVPPFPVLPPVRITAIILMGFGLSLTQEEP